MRQHDDRLLGISVNDEDPLTGEGDESISCMRIRCGGDRCGKVVGVVWFNTPAAGSGREPIYFVEVEAVDRLNPLPVRTRTVTTRLLRDRLLLADCAAHGRIEVPSNDLLFKARAVVSETADRMKTHHALPVGMPVGHDLAPVLDQAEVLTALRKLGHKI